MEEKDIINDPEKWPKSEPSIYPSYIRFINRTERRVDVIWIDYQAKPQYSNTLGPSQFLDVNTFVGHPWIFKDTDTAEHMVVQRKIFYLPKRLPQRPVRRCVNITLPVYPLKIRCFQVFKKLLQNRNKILELEIPSSLKRELEEHFVTNDKIAKNTN